MKTRFAISLPSANSLLWIPIVIIGLLFMAVVLVLGIQPAAVPSAQRAPFVLAAPPLELLTKDGSVPTCSTLVFRDPVWTGVCFGNRGEEWLLERRPGDDEWTVTPWPREDRLGPYLPDGVRR